MSVRRRRLAVVGAVAVLAAVLAVIPVSPVERLANYTPDGPGPIYDQPGIDDAAIRQAGRLIPGDARYLVAARPYGNVSSAALLYFNPALPVGKASLAGWVFDYHVGRGLPAGLREVRRYRVGDDVYLVRVRHA